jgi:hypothetical protein
MFQPNTRRALVSAALASVLSLLPAHAAAPRSQRPQQARSEKPGAVRIAEPIWDFAARLLSKVGVRIDPNGSRLTINTDSEGNEPSSQQDRNN